MDYIFKYTFSFLVFIIVSSTKDFKFNSVIVSTTFKAIYHEGENGNSKHDFNKDLCPSRSLRAVVALSARNTPGSPGSAGPHGSDIPLGARGADVASGSDVVFNPGEHGRHRREHGLHRWHGRSHRRTLGSRSWAWSLGSRRREVTPLPPIIGAWWRGPNLSPAADHSATGLWCLRLRPEVPPSPRAVEDHLILRIFGIEIGFNVVDKKLVL